MLEKGASKPPLPREALKRAIVLCINEARENFKALSNASTRNLGSLHSYICDDEINTWITKITLLLLEGYTNYVV